MKHLLLILTAIICALPSMAQLNGDGYYRVQNYKTGRYIYVIDDKGRLDYQSSTADMGAITLWRGFEKASCDPATICLIVNHGDRNHDISAQGTGIHEIIDSYVKIREIEKHGTYYAYGSKEGITKYLSDAEKADLDQGALGDAASAGEYREWYIKPIGTSSDNFFGVKPSLNVGGSYYAAYFTEFPYSFASSGMQAFYVSKVENGYAIIKEIKGTIPGNTPVYLKVNTDFPIDNKLNIGGKASSISDNIMKGVFFMNHSGDRHENVTAYDPQRMRVLGTKKDGTLGFITSNIQYLPANSSYIPVTVGTPAELTIITEEEYEKLNSKKPTSITFDKTQIRLAVGEKYTLKATVLPEDAFNKTITWVTNNPAIALMDNGTVTAVSEGIVNVTGTTVNGLMANCEVIVKNPVMPTGITLDKTHVSLLEGEKITLKATILPEDASDKTITWNTNNPGIALVENGTITAVKEGVVNITATTCNGFSANCEVVVKKPVMPTGITLDKTQITLFEGEKFTLKATILPENATDQTITWVTNNPAIALMDNGTVTAVKEGVVNVTAATCNGFIANCEVIVKKHVFPEGISFDKSELVLVLGEKATLKPIFTPENATEILLKWASDNEGVAKVEDGVVTAIAIGEANITATTVNDFKATCKIIVKTPEILAESISLDKDVYEAVEGSEFTLVATILPEDASSKTVEWTSSDIEVATVKDGVVKVLKEGTANITATTTDGTNLSAVCIVNGLSGIEEIFADVKQFPVKVYNAAGVLVKTAYSVNDFKGLAAGMYIIGGKKVVLAK